jgi:A/G-specific adenine glycosylase
VLDGNVKRVLARLFEIEAAVNVSSSHKIFYEKAALVFDRQNPATFNQAAMELGAIVCRPANPSCAVCPLQRCCAARHHSAVQDFPRRRRSGSVPEHPIAVGVVFKNRHMLITQRREEGLLGGLWEFPGGKLQKNESPESACIREIKEEVNLDVCIDQHIARVKHAYTHFKIRMDVFCCRYTGGRVKLRGPIAHRWITFDEITGFPLPRANHKFLPQLKAYCEQHPDLFENARRSSHSTAH